MDSIQPIHILLICYIESDYLDFVNDMLVIGMIHLV